MRLILLYHGEAERSAGRCIGRSDVPLSAAGRRDMEALSSQWPYPPPASLTASSRQRCVASLAPFARRFGRLPQVDARLDEQDFGEWDGELWARLYEDRGDQLHGWLNDWAGQAPPNGESFNHVAERAAEWLDERVEHSDDHDLHLVASHAGPIRALLCHALAIPLQHALLLRLEHGHLAGLRRHRGRFELCYWNASRFEASLFGDFA